MSYFCLRFSRVPSAKEDLVAEAIFEFGAAGVSRVLDFQQPESEYNPVIVETELVDLDIYFESPPPEGLSARLLALAPEAVLEIHERPTEDWLALWKESFTPFPLVGEYWVVPSWCDIPEDAKRPIFIDPGMAFGTGTHATTKLASQLLVPIAQGKQILDIGTGTGILAMLAAKQGARNVVAIEIDPIAREVARENIEANKVDAIEVVESSIESLTGFFDVVVANIIDGVLVKIKPHILRLLRPGGDLVLSGILNERDSMFVEQFLAGSGLGITQRLEMDEWVAYRMS